MSANEAEPISDEQIREVLAWCIQNPAHENALPALVELRDHLQRPGLESEVLAACEAVANAVIVQPAPPPNVHAEMTILLSALMPLVAGRERVDVLFAAWLRNPSSFGGVRATPPAYQKDVFVQRIGDLLGWGALDLRRDRDALGRFMAWVNSWTPRNKYRVRRAVDQLRRYFPDAHLWKLHLEGGAGERGGGGGAERGGGGGGGERRGGGGGGGERRGAGGGGGEPGGSKKPR